VSILSILSNLDSVGTAVTLPQAGKVLVAEGVTVASSQGIGLLAPLSSHSILVNGTVVGGSTGIVLGDSAFDAFNKVQIAEGASVFGDSAGVRVTGYESMVVNNGEIAGFSHGLTLDLAGRITVLNEGSISGYYGIVVNALDATLTGATQRSLITNTGTVHGLDIAFFGSAAEDRFVNKGLVMGDIHMGDGRDFYDGRGGEVEGETFMGLGDDRILPGMGEELIDGQQGFDTLDFRSSAGLRVSLLDDTGSGAATGDSYYGIEQVLGSRWGADTLIGDGLANVLQGFGGADRLLGGAGADRLAGGADADRLTGGLNHDSFEFTAPDGSADIITDFRNTQQDNDRILISAPGFGGGLVGNAQTPIALATSQFRSRADNLAQDGDDRFVFRTTDASLWFDVDGKGGAAAVMIADLQAGAVVTAADIWLL